MILLLYIWEIKYFRDSEIKDNDNSPSEDHDLINKLSE